VARGAGGNRRWTRRGLIAAAVGAVAGFALAIGGATSGAMAGIPWSGQAWQHAYGRYVTYTNGETIWRGSEWIDGMQVYCLEPRWHSPEAGDSYAVWDAAPGTFWAEGDSNSGTIVTAAQAQAVNWLVAAYGQIPDDQNALNVASAIRTFLHEADGNGDAPGTNLYRNALPYLEALRSYAAPPAPASQQTVAMTLRADPTDHYLGSLRLDTVPLTTIPVTIALTNGIFAENGSTTITLPAVSAGLELPIRGIPPTSDGEPYRIRAALVGSGVITTGSYPETLRMVTHDWNHQEQVEPQPVAQYPVTLSGSAEDAMPRTSGFFPTVETLVPTGTVSAGEPFRDTVRVSAGTSPDGVRNEWPRDPATGDYASVTVDCLVYGPLASQPEELDEAPPGTPIASSFTVVTGTEGPDATYETSSAEALAVSGTYTAVCRIAADEQPEPNAVAAGYVYTDRYGQATETVNVPAPEGVEVPAELAETGLTIEPPLMLAAAGALVAAGLAFASIRRRGLKRSASA